MWLMLFHYISTVSYKAFLFEWYATTAAHIRNGLRKADHFLYAMKMRIAKQFSQALDRTKAYVVFDNIANLMFWLDVIASKLKWDKHVLLAKLIRLLN